jgi:glutathione S-transferase
MIIYGSSLSPYVRKVLVVASEKGVPFDLKTIGLGDPDPAFRAASPFGKMPALVDGDYSISDSSAIVHYLEAKFPDPALIPADPEQRGKVIWFEEFADTMLMECGRKMFFNRVVAPRFLKREGNAEVADKAEREELPPLLDYLEGALAGRDYLVGESLTLADIAVASVLVNLEHCGAAVEAGRWPSVAEFAARIHARPSFTAFLERERAALARPLA